MKLVVTKAISKKTSKTYYYTYIDMGYRKISVSFDVSVAAEIAGLSIRELIDFFDVNENDICFEIH